MLSRAGGSGDDLLTASAIVPAPSMPRFPDTEADTNSSVPGMVMPDPASPPVMNTITLPDNQLLATIAAHLQLLGFLPGLAGNICLTLTLGGGCHLSP